MNKWVVVAGSGVISGIFFFVVVSGLSLRAQRQSPEGSAPGASETLIRSNPIKDPFNEITTPQSSIGARDDGGDEIASFDRLRMSGTRNDREDGDLAMVINSGVVPNTKIGSMNIEEGIHTGKLIVGEGRVTKPGLPRNEKPVHKKKK